MNYIFSYVILSTDNRFTTEHMRVFTKVPPPGFDVSSSNFSTVRELKSSLGFKWTSFGPTSTCVRLSLPSLSATRSVSFYTRKWRARNETGEKSSTKQRRGGRHRSVSLNSVQPISQISKGYVFFLWKKNTEADFMQLLDLSFCFVFRFLDFLNDFESMGFLLPMKRLLLSWFLGFIGS